MAPVKIRSLPSPQRAILDAPYLTRQTKLTIGELRLTNIVDGGAGPEIELTRRRGGRLFQDDGFERLYGEQKKQREVSPTVVE
jgi:hypothetical protein